MGGPSAMMIEQDGNTFTGTLEMRMGPADIQEGKNVWLMGGGELFAAFLDRGALDELIIYIIPILIGAGIPLLAAARRTTELHLQSTRRYSDGVVRLHYLVESKPKRPSRST